MLKHLLPAALVSFLAACAANPNTQFTEQVQSTNTPIAHSYQEAIRQARATPLPINRGLFPVRWEIGGQEPRIDLGQAPANYRLFNFQMHKGQAYVINVGSLCNNMCFGLTKTALKPKAVVLDAQGNVVADHLTGANALVIEWSGVAPADGAYFLLIAADNQAPGEHVSTINSPVPGQVGMSLALGMNSAPFGKVITYVEFPDAP